MLKVSVPMVPLLFIWDGIVIMDSSYISRIPVEITVDGKPPALVIMLRLVTRDIPKFVGVAVNMFYVFFQTAIGILKQDFEPESTKLQDAVKLAVKVMHKTLDVTKLTADKSKQPTTD